MCLLYTHFIMNPGPHKLCFTPVASSQLGIVSAASSLVSTVGCERGLR